MKPGSSDDRVPAEGRTYGVPRLREQVLRRLAEAYADNNLDLEEYEKRVGRAEQARTVEELQGVLADFEAPPSPGPSPAGGPPRGDPEVIFSLLGDREIAAGQIEGGSVNLFTVIGDTRLDLSSLRGGETLTVTSVSVIGDTRLLVPPGTVVVRRCLALIGGFKRKKGREPSSGTAPATIILQGFKVIGDVIVTET